MSKVLWLSDAGCTTGFGRVTHSIGERLVRDYGHEINVLAVNHRGDWWPSELDPTKPTPLRLYRPNTLLTTDIYGKSRIIELLGKEPDVVVSLNDPQIMLGFLFNNEQWDPDHYLLRYRPIIYYVPCDGINTPPFWSDVLTKVTNVVAMSKWGQQQYPGSQLVYHGVDTSLFWPVSEEHPITTSTGITCTSKEDCKAAFGMPRDSFLVGRIDSNTPRKDYPATIKALWPVMERHPEVIAHFHCEDKEMGSGVRFEAMLSRRPDINARRFFFPGLHTSFEGWPQQDLNAVLNAMDIYVSTSTGEGFGLGLAEAAAAAVPIIAQNVSAIPEVVGPGGILLEPERLITVRAGHDNWLADIDAFTDAIEELYADPERREELGRAGREHVERSFNWDVATSRFHEYIEALASQGTEASEVGDAVQQQ